MTRPQIMLYDANNIDTFVWPENTNGEYAKKYLYPLIKNGVENYIKNIRTKMLLLSIDDIVLPVTVNDTEYDNSYVCSPYTHYITYAIEELRELKKPWIELLLKLVLKTLGMILKKGSINKTIHVNNWLLSTNLYPELSEKQLFAITSFLNKEYKNYAIVFRSINSLSLPKLFAFFSKSDCLMVASRQVYIYDNIGGNKLSSKAKAVQKKDFKLMEKSSYKWLDADSMDNKDIPRLQELYNALYLHKYSFLNPQFTEAYLKLALRDSILELKALQKNGRIDGVIGFFIRNGVMTTPLLGYDTNVPRAEGLYRMLCARLNQEAEKRGLIRNQSSGASEFKKNRGGIPCIEYSAVYTNHLPLYRRLAWQLLAFMANKIGTYLLRKHEL